MPKRPVYHASIASRTATNLAFRRVLHTGQRSQLVAMSIPRGDAVGTEVHPHVEQLFFIQSGRGQLRLGTRKRTLKPGDVVMVPPGTMHNIVNIGNEPLKLFTVYAPPNHIDGTVHKTSADALRDKADEAYGRRVR